jgi:hypothetical protein
VFETKLHMVALIMAILKQGPAYQGWPWLKLEMECPFLVSPPHFARQFGLGGLPQIAECEAAPRLSPMGYCFVRKQDGAGPGRPISRRAYAPLHSLRWA